MGSVTTRDATRDDSTMTAMLVDDALDDALARVDDQMCVVLQLECTDAGWTATSLSIPWRCSRTTAGCCRSARSTRG